MPLRLLLQRHPAGFLSLKHSKPLLVARRLVDSLGLLLGSPSPGSCRFLGSLARVPLVTLLLLLALDRALKSAQKCLLELVDADIHRLATLAPVVAGRRVPN